MTTKKKAKRALKEILSVTIAPSVIQGIKDEADRRMTSTSAIAQEAFMEYLASRKPHGGLKA